MNTTTQIPASVDAYYDRKLLLRVYAANLHGMFAQMRPIVRNGGTGTIRFRRYTNLVPATTPLTEGQNPAGTLVSVTDLTATVLEYGNYIPLSSTVEWMTVNGELTELSDMLDENAVETLDILSRDVLNAGTSVFYGGNATLRSNVDSTDLIDVASLRLAQLYLKNNNAKKITRFASTNNDVDTQNLRECYVAIVHPDITETLRTLTGWIDREKYAHNIEVMPEEVGKLGDIRFIETTNAKVFAGEGASGIDVYSTLVLAREAYGRSYITGETTEMIIKPVGSAGAADPLNRFGTMGWYSTFITKRLNEQFMTRVEHASAY